MRRQKSNSRRSKNKFSRTASKVHPRNRSTVKRGGLRI